MSSTGDAASLGQRHSDLHASGASLRRACCKVCPDSPANLKSRPPQNPRFIFSFNTLSLVPQPMLGRQWAALASHYRIPAIYHQRAAVEKGGLMSYGSGRTAAELPLVGQYTARILKGEKPGDLPVQRATTVDFVINLKTAKALGLTIPLTLYARADELVE